jgi:hypothetical protein
VLTAGLHKAWSIFTILLEDIKRSQPGLREELEIALCIFFALCVGSRGFHWLYITDRTFPYIRQSVFYIIVKYSIQIFVK